MKVTMQFDLDKDKDAYHDALKGEDCRILIESTLSFIAHILDCEETEEEAKKYLSTIEKFISEDYCRILGY